MSFAKSLASVILTLLFSASIIAAAKKDVTPKQSLDPVARTSPSALTSVDKPPIDGTSPVVRVPIASGYKSSMFVDSPGLILGHTWYEKQRNGSMRRMTRWGQHLATIIDSVENTPGCTPANPCTTVADQFISHFHWMRLMPPFDVGRHWAYQAWISDPVFGGRLLNSGEGAPATDSVNDWGGYVVLDVTNDNRAVLAGHLDYGSTGHSRTAALFGHIPGGMEFEVATVLDSIQEYVGPGSCVGQEVIWPAMAYHEGDGTAGFADTVLHIVGSVSDADSQCLTAVQSIYYFRKVGGSNYGADGVWDYPPYVVDTNFTLSHDIFCSKQSGKVVMAWCAARPDPGDCDTCSSNTGDNSVGSSQLDNDLYIQTSLDQGATWQPRVNLTLREHPDSISEDTYWPFIDLNVLIDQDDDETHVVWNARHYVSGSGTFKLACRILHWSESQGFESHTHSLGKLRGMSSVVHDAVWNQVYCNGGSWELNASKMTISQCNDKHYVIWEQFNDIPNGVDDDCAARAFTSGGGGAANGELFVAVSSDGGVTWDDARNITNSYSSGCTPPGGGGEPCESDIYASMSPYGYDFVGDFPTNVVIPDGGMENGWYVDIQYVNDPDAGKSAANDGTWQQADIKWMRLACVEPVPKLAGPLPIYPFNIHYPAHGYHGQQVDTPIILNNQGNVAINYTVTLFELTGTSGWLQVSGLSGSLPSGIGSSDTGTIHLNNGGIVNSPGTVVSLIGGLEFVSNLQSSPDTVPISFWVVDTVAVPKLDTISNSVFSLIVSNTGNMGNTGAGGVNMDFVYSDSSGPDCNPDANMVLFDGSPFVMWVDGTDTVANWSIYSDGWLSDNGFRPRVGTHKFESYLFECYSTGVFSTNDSSIFLEKTWYSPRNYGTNDGGFFVQCVRLWSADGLPKDNLTIGEAIDWDVPSDSSVRNSSNFVLNPGNPTFNLIYQQGANYDDGDTTECQDNSRRVAGIAPRGTRMNGSLINSGNVHDAFTIDNPTYVFPNGTFSPQQLYDKIDSWTGFQVYSSAHPDSEFVDLSMVVTNLHQYNLGPNDTLTMYCVIASSIDTDPSVGPVSEFRNWINAGIGFMNVRVLYDSWYYPNHIAVDASTMKFAGDVSGGAASAGATVTYDVIDNTTTVTGPAPIAYLADGFDELILLSVGSSPTAFLRSRWLSAETPTNPGGDDTAVFLHSGEGIGAAKVATFAWFEGTDPAIDLAANFANPEDDPNLSALVGGFVQATTNLTNYLGWDPNVPPGNDIGVPRTVNEAVFDLAAVSGDWLYVKTTTDGAGGPFAGGIQIEGFSLFQSCCKIPGDVNNSGSVDIADLTYIVSFLFKSGPTPVCCAAADIDGSCSLDIGDITTVVAYMFKNQWWRAPICPPRCPPGSYPEGCLY